MILTRCQDSSTDGGPRTEDDTLPCVIELSHLALYKDNDMSVADYSHCTVCLYSCLEPSNLDNYLCEMHISTRNPITTTES